MPSQDKIRNFCIIAHIDHGKSTLADRLLEVTGAVAKRAMREQLLDTMELEREKGITIKLQPVRLQWQQHELNLIDTPGHVDFSYEVSRSLTACEGAVLVVDSTQGIQAQTLANVYLAIEAGLEIIPVVNKIDLPAAEPERVAKDIAELIGCGVADVIRVSAKTGLNVEQILDRIVSEVPAPTGELDAALRCLVFDSIYDEHRGVVLYVRVVDGQLAKSEKIWLVGAKSSGLANEVGSFSPMPNPQTHLKAGEIGYIVTNLKAVEEARVGDTVTTQHRPAKVALAGYQDIKPFVYAGFFPASSEQQQLLKEALQRLKLNDASLQFEPESSSILGFGFRVGFLGLLHLEIIKERLQREYGIELIITNPTTEYQLILTSGEQKAVKAASELPEAAKIAEIREPWIKAEVIAPKNFVGSLTQLISDIRGTQSNVSYKTSGGAVIEFEAPLANVLTDFYDQLKSVTSGYGSLSYELAGFRTENLVKLDFLVGGEVVDPLSQIVHRREAEPRGRESVKKLKDVIPRQLYEVSIQAAIGGKIIAREDIKALGKNVTAKLYGGDVSRKQKLWKKQKAGKSRMKKLGQVEIPPEAFTTMLKKD